jgi:NitT/TauT family transport system substrate-binding protein
MLSRDLEQKSLTNSRELLARAARLMVLAGLALSPLGCKPKPTSEPEKPTSAPAAAPSAVVNAAPATPTPSGPPLGIAYSDWPGWVAWEIGIQKGWFKEAGVNVEFKWFEYAPSMDAYSAGKVDAVAVTNGDALVTGRNSGAASVCILVNDYSDGNDMIVAKPGIKSIADLKGKKVGVEVGFVDHLLLLNALKSANMAQSDIKIVNVVTDQTPQALKSGSVVAVAAWQPNSGAALKEVPGSTPIFTSKNVPGLIYDHLCVNPKSLAERRADWVKVVAVWDRIAKFIGDQKNVDEAAKIMSARVGLTAEQYKPLMKGTHIMALEEGSKHWVKSDGFESIYGSSKIVDDFNTKNGVYKKPGQTKIEDYFDPGLTQEVLHSGKTP